MLVRWECESLAEAVVILRLPSFFRKLVIQHMFRHQRKWEDL